jgi:hypothetical protein
MEVHAHTHTSDPDRHRGKKKFIHYLWEFLMLFLAVFCGFLAENFREHQVEHQREKQYMQSLTEDVRQDIQALDSGIQKSLIQISGKDSLVQLLGDGITTDEKTNLFYRLHWSYVGYVTEIPFSRRTMNQLLNAGGLRLVLNQKVSNAIASYAARVDYHEKIRQPQYIDVTFRALFASEKLIDTRFMRALPDTKYIRAPYEKPVVRNANADQLKDFSFALEMDKENCILFVQDLEQLKKLAVDLLNLLEKEYHPE